MNDVGGFQFDFECFTPLFSSGQLPPQNSLSIRVGYFAEY
jgi:hypothetical protein